MTTTTRAHIRQEILDYLRQARFNDYDGELTFDTPLLQVGLIDSLSMMTVVLFLEQKYGLDFFVSDIRRDDFASVDALATMLATSLEGQHAHEA